MRGKIDVLSDWLSRNPRDTVKLGLSQCRRTRVIPTQGSVHAPGHKTQWRHPTTLQGQPPPHEPPKSRAAGFAGGDGGRAATGLSPAGFQHSNQTSWASRHRGWGWTRSAGTCVGAAHQPQANVPAHRSAALTRLCRPSPGFALAPSQSPSGGQPQAGNTAPKMRPGEAPPRAAAGHPPHLNSSLPFAFGKL